MNQTKQTSKCNFCTYYSGRSCMVTPNSYYCRDANNEYYQQLRNKANQPAAKSLRSWDRR